MMRYAALLIIACVCLTAAPAVAQEGDDISFSRDFNVDLVNSVKKSCVYIWAMSPGGVGAMQAAWIGSGVIFMADEENDAAYALTNFHVANNTTALQVELWDNSTYHAETIGLEPGIDTAVIKLTNIKRDAYEPCILGDSDRTITGELCLAVGAPGDGASVNTDRSDPSISFGLHQTTTLAVVTGRQTEPWDCIGSWTGWRQQLGYGIMTNCPWRFITQAAINGGNSGGPLFNSKGECIGLNHAGYGVGAASFAQNFNFTIPINFSKDFAFQIMNNEKHEIPWFGIDVFFPKSMNEGSTVMEFYEKHFDEEVIRVLSVRDNSPATKAKVVSTHARDKSDGLRAGDIIVEFDGRTFDTSYDLRLYVFNMQIGQKVPVTVKRGRNKVDLELTVGSKRTYDSQFSL